MKDYHIDWSAIPVHINRIHLWLDNTQAERVYYQPQMYEIIHSFYIDKFPESGKIKAITTVYVYIYICRFCVIHRSLKHSNSVQCVRYERKKAIHDQEIMLYFNTIRLVLCLTILHNIALNHNWPQTLCLYVYLHMHWFFACVIFSTCTYWYKFVVKESHNGKQKCYIKKIKPIKHLKLYK